MRRVADDVDYNGLRKAEPTLPSAWYFEAEHHAREISGIWHRNWLMAGRADEAEICFRQVIFRP